MWSRIKQFMTPPHYQDSERALVTNLLNTILLSVLGFALLINLILPFINPDANYLTSGALLAVALGLFVFIRYGGYRGVQISSVLLCGAMWLLVTLNGWTEEGLRNMSSILYLILTIMAGLLLGGKGAVIFGMLSIGGAFLLYYGEFTGMLRFESRGVTFTDWVKFVLIELLAMLLVRFTVLHLLRAMDRLRQSEKLLALRAEELSIVNGRLRTLGKAKDEFVANVSHELRSPITSLIMYEDLLARRPDRLDQYLPVLKRETVRLGDLIEDLLSISRLDQGRIDLKLEQFDLNELIQEFVLDRTPLAESRGLRLDIIEVADLPYVTGDRGMLGQSISILLTNSLNYTPAGGRVYVSSEIRRINGQQWAGFVVHDTGPGITEEDQKMVFTRFYRGQIGRRSGYPGTGLGLAIAKEIVERHQGQIEVRSEGIPGKGSTFKVWLPVE